MNLFLKIRSLFSKAKLDTEMTEEMRHHVELQTERNAAAGMKPDEARYAALRQFGNVAVIQEQAREVRGWRWLGDLLSDIRYAFRGLLKSPGFTVVAIVSLALGIGVSTAVFSIFNGVLLRSLPLPDPHELREVRWTGRDARVPSVDGTASVSPPVFLSLREQAAAQADLFGYAPVENVIVRAEGEAFVARGLMVSDNFFPGVGIRPFVGTLLGPGRDFAGAGTSVVLGFELWVKYCAADPAVVGRAITLNGTSFTVVGILPRGFTGVQSGQPAEFYVPMSANSQFLYVAYTSRFNWFVRLMARLKPGVADEQLRAALDTAFSREVADVMKEPHILLEPGRSGAVSDGPAYRKPLFVMSGVIGLVMLVACANLAGLSLARGAARRHELAVRAALGAGRWRLIRQSLAESLVLALLGGFLALPVAVWARVGIAQLLADSTDGLHYNVSINPTVLGFMLAVALVTAVFSGLIPAFRAGQADPLGGLKHSGALDAPRLRTGRVLVALQIGLSLLLLAGAGLYVRTLVNLANIDAGFSPEKLLLFQLNIRGSGAADAQPAQFYERVQAALEAVPGVADAALIDFPLLSGASSSGDVNLSDGRSATAVKNGQTRRLRVGDTFFATFGLPVMLGRAFTAGDDAGAPKVVVVNEAFVRKYLSGENPIGRTLRMWEADWQIVGVCRDAKFNSLRQMVPPITYFPFRQMFYSRFRTTHLRGAYFAVRTAASPESLVPVIRQAVASIDASVALNNVTTQEEVRDRSISQERLLAMLCGALAVLALLLSCIGLYGLMAFNVARRRSEIAIRMAIGAQPRDIARPILREALVLSAIGVIAGLPVLFSVTHLIRSQLYGVESNDPLILGLVIIILAGVSLLAAWLPARRATQIDPLVALRTE